MENFTIGLSLTFQFKLNLIKRCEILDVLLVFQHKFNSKVYTS